MALRSHVVETRLEWRTKPMYLSNEHSVALQLWMIVRVGVSMPRSRLPPLKRASSSRSACLGQVSGHVGRGHAVLDLRVSDGAVLLSEMQP